MTHCFPKNSRVSGEENHSEFSAQSIVSTYSFCVFVNSQEQIWEEKVLDPIQSWGLEFVPSELQASSCRTMNGKGFSKKKKKGNSNCLGTLQAIYISALWVCHLWMDLLGATLWTLVILWRMWTAVGFGEVMWPCFMLHMHLALWVMMSPIVITTYALGSPWAFQFFFGRTFLMLDNLNFIVISLKTETGTHVAQAVLKLVM